MRRRWVVATVIGLAGALVVGRIAAGWVVDFQWYQALGATDVFWAKATDFALVRGVAFLAGTLLALINVFAVRYSVKSVALPQSVGNLEIREEVPSRYLTWAVPAISLGLGCLLALLHRDWPAIELFRHGDPFRESDPHFQADLSFWLFTLPVEQSFHAWALIAVLAITLVVTFLYALTPSLRWEEGRLKVHGHVRRHLIALGGAFILLLAWSYRLDAYQLLLQGSGDRGAFVALDRRVGVPVFLVLSLVTLVGAMLWTWAGWMGQHRMAIATLVALGVVTVGARQLAPMIARRTLRPTDPALRDRPYLATRAAFTRRAFAIDVIENDTTKASALDRSAVARSSSLWDVEALTQTLRSQRVGRRERGAFGWDLREDRLATFAVQQPSGPEASEILAPWTVSTFEATLTEESGRLTRGVLESPGDGRIPAALVYDSAPGFAVVVDSMGAIAAPVLTTTAKRLFHAWTFQTPRLLRTAPVSEPPKLLAWRDVHARVERLFPVFAQGRPVVPILARDSVWWSVHLYSTSNSYPLSEVTIVAGKNSRYFKHAGVALINAHTGRTVAIADPAADPIASTWARRFPSLFVPASAVDRETLRQIPPPVEALLNQARVFASLGRRGENGPPSHLPRLTGADTVFALPIHTPFADAATKQLAIALPVVDAAERLRGMVVGSGGPAPRTRWVSLDSQPRWDGVLELMRRGVDSLISLGGNDSPAVVRGPVRAVVAGRALALLQTSYAWPSDNAPAVKYASVWIDHRIVTGTTVAAALGVPAPLVSAETLTPQAFRSAVARYYGRMQAALQRNDLAAFGVAYDSLGRLLRSTQRSP